MEKKENIKKEGMNSVGKAVTFGLSALLAGYLSRKLLQKYPSGEVTNFVKRTIAIFIIVFVIILCLLVVATVIYGLNDAFHPEPETVIEKAQRQLKERNN